MFENKKINGYTYATRYIMSWVRAGGIIGLHNEGVDEFRKWLKTLNLKDEDVKYIINLATNGKLELEYSAKKFLNECNNPK